MDQNKVIPINLSSSSSLSIPSDIISIKKGNYILWSNQIFENTNNFINKTEYVNLLNNFRQTDVEQTSQNFLKTYGFYSVFSVEYINPRGFIQQQIYGQIKLKSPSYVNYNSYEELDLTKLKNGQVARSSNILSSGTTLCLIKDNNNNYLLKAYDSTRYSIENSYFILTYKGYWYSVKHNVYIIPTDYQNTDTLYKFSYRITESLVTAKQNKWMITEPKFGIGTKDSLSIWNTGILTDSQNRITEYSFPFDGKGAEYQTNYSASDNYNLIPERSIPGVLEYEDKWFSNPFGDYSLNPDTWKKSNFFGTNGELYSCGRATCFSGNRDPIRRCDIRHCYNDVCPSFMKRIDTWRKGGNRAKCIYTGWKEENRENCFIGNAFLSPSRPNSASGITFDNANFPKIPHRIDGEKCKLYRITRAEGEGIKTVDVNANNPTEIWGPWTQNIIKGDIPQTIIDFCSQQDTITNDSFFSSSRFKNTCGKIYSDYGNKKINQNSSNTLSETLNLEYVRKYPLNKNSTAYCNTIPKLTPSNITNKNNCENFISNECFGPMLESDACIEFCKITGKDCNTNLDNYCQELINFDNFFDSTKTDEITLTRRNLCGCHMKPSFYDKFFSVSNSALIKKGVPVQQFSAVKECNFLPCILSDYKTIPANPCPDGQVCISSIKINTDGSVIDADVNINVDINCNINTIDATENCLTSSNILNQKCIDYCKTNARQCDSFLRNYCKNRVEEYRSNGDNFLVSEIDITFVSLCAKYMPQEFYGNLSTIINNELSFSETIPDICFYKPYYSVLENNCPTESSCINYEDLGVTITGNVSGKITKLEDALCKNVNKKSGIISTPTQNINNSTTPDTAPEVQFYEKWWFWVIIIVIVIILVVVSIIKLKK